MTNPTKPEPKLTWREQQTLSQQQPPTTYFNPQQQSPFDSPCVTDWRIDPEKTHQLLRQLYPYP